MEKKQKFVFDTCFAFALLVSFDAGKATSCSKGCSDGLGLNYTLPMFNECKVKEHPNGSMVQTFPKLIPYSSSMSSEASCPRRKSKLGIPPGHRVCRFPDCGSSPCKYGWCEETMEGYECHCPTGFQGKLCAKQSTGTTDATTMSTGTIDATTMSTSKSTVSSVSPRSTSSPTSTNASSHPRDCSEIQAGGVNISGVYRIYPDGVTNASDVYCDMETDGGGWTVFQRRQDGSVDFYLDWVDYKNGFGNVSGEHWLGNDNIHRLSTQKTYELRVDLEDFEGETRNASYSSFNITDEAAKYKLTIGDYSGDAGDSLIYHQGRFFSTKDRDNDDTDGRCAVRHTGAWWYDHCHHSNLNGQYLNETTIEQGTGVTWFHWHGFHYSLKKTEMKIRPA